MSRLKAGCTLLCTSMHLAVETSRRDEIKGLKKVALMTAEKRRCGQAR